MSQNSDTFVPVRILLTSRVLDILGFGPYNDGAGDFGLRTLRVDGPDGSSTSLQLLELDEKDDASDGYLRPAMYVDGHLSIWGLEVKNPPVYLGLNNVSCLGERVDFVHELIHLIGSEPNIPSYVWLHLIKAAAANGMSGAYDRNVAPGIVVN